MTLNLNKVKRVVYDGTHECQISFFKIRHFINYCQSQFQIEYLTQCLQLYMEKHHSEAFDPLCTYDNLGVWWYLQEFKDFNIYFSRNSTTYIIKPTTLLGVYIYNTYNH